MIDFIKNAKCEIVIARRKLTDELIDLSDYVSEVKKIINPFDNGVVAQLCIEL